MPIALAELEEIDGFEWTYTGLITVDEIRQMAHRTFDPATFPSTYQALLVVYSGDVMLSELDDVAMAEIRETLARVREATVGERRTKVAHVCVNPLNRIAVEHYIAQLHPKDISRQGVFTTREDAVAWLNLPMRTD